MLAIDTPFCESTGNAEARVKHHRDRGHTGIHIVEIRTKWLSRGYLKLDVGEHITHLPIWVYADLRDKPLCIFLSTADARRYLGVSAWVGQMTEWFALGRVPAGMIWRGRVSEVIEELTEQAAAATEDLLAEMARRDPGLNMRKLRLAICETLESARPSASRPVL